MWGTEAVGEREIKVQSVGCSAVNEATALLIVTAVESLASTLAAPPQAVPSAQQGALKTQQVGSRSVRVETEVDTSMLSDSDDFETWVEDRGSGSRIPPGERYRINVRTGAAALISSRIEPMLSVRAGQQLVRREAWAFGIDLGLIATWGVPRERDLDERSFYQSELYALTADGCLQFLKYGLGCAGIATGLVRVQGDSSENAQLGLWAAAVVGLHARVPMGRGGMVFGASGTFAPIAPEFAGEDESSGPAVPRWGRILTWGLEYVF